MPEKILLAISTFPDAETARRISNQLVTERFAACANIFPSVESIYRWKEKIETGNETLRLFQSQRRSTISVSGKAAIASSLRVPEIIFVPVAGGSPEYLQWVSENCGQPRWRFLPAM